MANGAALLEEDFAAGGVARLQILATGNTGRAEAGEKQNAREENPFKWSHD